MGQLSRYYNILDLLPGKESAYSIRTIHQRLANKGVHVSIRTLQRDMPKIQEKFPHVFCQDDLWWAEQSLAHLYMPPTDAMNLVMIMNHAAKFGMAAQVEKLAPLRDYATSLLKGNKPRETLKKTS